MASYESQTKGASSSFC